MNYRVEVDRVKKRITTKWGERVDDASLMSYKIEVWKDPSISDYDEIIDFNDTKIIQISAEGLLGQATLSAEMDKTDRPTKLAIVVAKPLPHGLARMYKVFRDNEPKSRRTVKIFKEYTAAMRWIEDNRAL